jgi:hypothetical protein
MSMDDLRSYAQLLDERDQLEERLRWIRQALQELEPRCLEWFQREGVDRLVVDGRTLYLRRELWASIAEGVSHDDAAAALQTVGLGDMVRPRINLQTLSAWCREQEREMGAPVPPLLTGVVSAREVYRVGTRRGE